ncbi:hypothetical protein [Winogradskyella sp. SYSU M77433]|uniref:hypothetical protein n=1 Tax=Winogradskyella sp. SYSU M77433 TaxID=3042722 RepID=UPI00247FC737|nr:hypothetical protein [Winogradskyella sp. SYSU M77433]MDH7912212.1 hypothetical protein [Winogradskyella sp. SYSU M77433]
MNIRIKRILSFSILPLMAMLFMSTSGGGKGTKKDTSGGCTVKERDTEIVLFQMSGMPPGRINNWAVPASPSLWTGASSASSLFSNPNQYYCVITISASCANYNKEYVWNPDTSGGTTMTIPIPENTEFRISVEYWEQCGPYWGSSNSPSYARGLWFSEITQGYATSIGISNWIYLRRESC